MIRRSDHNHWLLIDQIEHARISAELATEWADPDWISFHQQWPIIEAIAHHDDGWKDWDSCPQIAPETGMPRDFTEMRLEDSTDIWRRSVEACLQFSPLSGQWVSHHFCWLAEQALSNRTDEQDRAAAHSFLEDQQLLIRNSLAESRIGLRWLQTFDRLSLWLCCTPAAEPRTLGTSSGQSIHMSFADPEKPDLNPWPFRSDRVQVQTNCRRVRATHYRRGDFQNALKSSDVTGIRWLLQR